jgi:hypothetical protein
MNGHSTIRINNVYHLVKDTNHTVTLCGESVPPHVMLDEKHRHETSCLACAERLKQLEKVKLK